MKYIIKPTEATELAYCNCACKGGDGNCNCDGTSSYRKTETAVS